MTWEVFGAFVVTSLILAVAPGPDNLFVLVQSAVYGARSGLAAVVAASDVLFWDIRILGALYLLYLVWGAWHAPHDAGIARGVALSYGALYRRGIVMNITNPKVQIFFLAFFPQFVTEFPVFLPGLEPREECGLSKFFNLGPNAAKPCT